MTNPTLHIKNMIVGQDIAISADAWNDFQEIWQETKVKRKTIISPQGQIEKYLYFVTEGVQRVYYFDEQNREATIIFTYPYSFAGVLDSFMLQSPSRYFFEALTNSVLLKTSYQQFQQVLKKHPEFEQFTHKTINVVLSGLLERIVELQCFSSEDKFRKLLQRSPHILQYVPHKYLANYLSIDPTNFSKLMNSIKI